MIINLEQCPCCEQKKTLSNWRGVKACESCLDDMRILRVKYLRGIKTITLVRWWYKQGMSLVDLKEKYKFTLTEDELFAILGINQQMKLI